MSVDEMRTAVERFLAALASDGDLAVLDELCTPEVALGWQQAMSSFGFSPRTFTVDKTVVEGDQVAALWSSSGTHSGDHAGLPATGRQTVSHGSAFFTFVDGRISALVSYYDAEDLLRQLGATIQPG
jgi:ketosteroid isomerase-like protein